MSKKFINELTYEIIGVAMEVHKTMGPGLLESVYHKCLAHEFNLRNISVNSECNVPVFYKEMELDTFFRCDFLVEDAIIIEVKAVEAILPLHAAFLINHMRLLQKPKGIMINFNCVNLFKEGQKTYVNEFYRNLPNE